MAEEPTPTLTPVPSHKASGLTRLFCPIAVFLLLLLMISLAYGEVRRESATVDEVAHIGAGVSYLQRLDLRLNREHPPLVKILAAVPLIVRRVRADYSSPEWTLSARMAPAHIGEWVFGYRLLMFWNDPVPTLAWARVPMLALMLLFAIFVWAVGKRIGGPWGGLLCVAAFASTPTFLAYGPVVLTDLPLAMFCVLSIWTFGELWREPSLAHVFVFGSALGAALLSKFSSGILFFAFGAFILTTRIRGLSDEPVDSMERAAWHHLRWRRTLFGVMVAALIVYVFYLIFSWNQPLNYLTRFVGSGSAARVLKRLLMPMRLYSMGVASLLSGSSRPTFILGRHYAHGVWFYFPVAFALKSPLGFLGLLLVLLGVAVAHRFCMTGVHRVIPEGLSAHWRMLWVSLVVFTAVCLLSRINIGIRHFGISIALLILLAAPLPRLLNSLQENHMGISRGLQVVVAALALSSLWTAVHTYPYYIPYFNPLGMGRPGYWLLNDSNLDYDEALPEVRGFAESHGLSTIDVDSRFTPLVAAGPAARFWDCERPTNADRGTWVIVAASSILDAKNCAWLVRYPHETLGGGSLYAFRLPAEIPEAGQLGGPPLRSGKRFDPLLFIDAIEHPEDIPLVVSRLGLGKGHKELREIFEDE